MLIDRQEKAVIRDCLHGLACQCPFIWIPFLYFLPFICGFPYPKLRYDVCAAVRPSLQGTEGCARSTAVCFIPLHAGASTCRNNRYSAIWASCLVVAPTHFRLLSAAFLSGPTASWANGDTFCLCCPSCLRHVTIRKSPLFVCSADRFFYPPKPSVLLSDAFYTGRWPIPVLFAIIACCHSLSATA